MRHFTILGQKNAQNMPRYYIVEQGKIRTEEERENGSTKTQKKLKKLAGRHLLLFSILTNQINDT